MMTVETKQHLFDLAKIAAANGNTEEADKILFSIPLSPKVAKIVKEVEGADYLRNSVFNLSEAEEVYGKDWLIK